MARYTSPFTHFIFSRLTSIGKIEVGPVGSRVTLADADGTLYNKGASLDGGQSTLSIGAFHSTTAGSGTPIDEVTTTAAFRVYVDDAGVALTPTGSVGDLRGSISRFLITADQSAVHARVWGLMGQVKIYNTLFSEEQTGGLCGRFELVQASSTTTLGGYGMTGAVTGIFATAGTTTVDTNHVAAAVLAMADIKGTCTQTGKVCGVAVMKYDTSQWSDSTSRAAFKYGLYIQGSAATIGGLIGSFAGSAATTGGVAFATAQNIWSDGQVSTFEVHGASASDLGSGYCAKVGRFRHVVNATAVAHETYGLMGQVVVKDTTITHLHAGLIGTFEGHTSGVVCNSAYTVGHAAVMARCDGGGAITATTPLAGFAAFWNGAALASGSSAAFATSQTGAGAWVYGLYFPASSVDVDIYMQSGSTIDDSNHLDIETLDDTKRIRLNDRNYAATSGDIIGFSAKPAANASGTQTVYGGQISPRFNDNVDGAALVGLMVEPILKGATVLALTGDMRAVDARLTSEGANTVGGTAGCLFCYNELPSSTYTGGVYPIVVKAAGKTQAWSALMEIPTALSGGANGSGADVYIPITINGVAARITAKYVS